MLPVTYDVEPSHHMVTGSKIGSSKPKVFIVTTSLTFLPKPSCYDEAKEIPKWEEAMKMEFSALIANGT